jgi:hypothetical protein
MDLWVQTNQLQGSLDAYQQERDQFTADNPVIQGYLDWQSQVNELGPKVFLDRLLRESDPFKLWWKARKVGRLQIRSVLMNESAYLAAHGDKPSMYDPVGTETSTSPNLDTLMPQVGGDSPEVHESWASMSDPAKIEHLTDQENIYMVRLEQFNDKVTAVTGGTPYSALAPISKMDIDIRLERMGITPPEPSGQYQLYLRWAQAQDMNSDRSIQAYVNHEVIGKLINPHGLEMLALCTTPHTRAKPRLVAKLITLWAFPDVINTLIGFGSSVVEKKFSFHEA